MNMKTAWMKMSVLAGMVCLWGSASLQAQLVLPNFINYAPSLGGTTADYQWNSFASETRPPGVSASINGTASQWTAGLAPTNASSSYRYSGNPGFGSDTTDFLATSDGGGIYSFFSQTHFQLASTAPVSGLKSLTFQIYMAEGLTGPTSGTSVALVGNPSLLLNLQGGGTATLAATYSLVSSSESVFIPAIGLNTNLDLLSYQWDISSVSGVITGYNLTWQTSFHSIHYGLDVTESNTTHANNLLQTVPEPSTYALIALGGLILVRVGRRSRHNFIS
jgi:hypothetical protein